MRAFPVPPLASLITSFFSLTSANRKLRRSEINHQDRITRINAMQIAWGHGRSAVRSLRAFRPQTAHVRTTFWIDIDSRLRWKGKSDPNPMEGTRFVPSSYTCTCYSRARRDTMPNPVRGLLLGTGIVILARL